MQNSNLIKRLFLICILLSPLLVQAGVIGYRAGKLLKDIAIVKYSISLGFIFIQGVFFVVASSFIVRSLPVKLDADRIGHTLTLYVILFVALLINIKIMSYVVFK